MLYAKKCGEYAGEPIYSIYNDGELLDTRINRELCQDVADTAGESIIIEL